MTDSSVFNPDEWAIISRAPILVFYFVANADDEVDANEVERLIELFGTPEEYNSAVFTQVVAELMSDPEELAATVAKILEDGNQDLASQFAQVRQSLDGKLNPDDAKAFKEALARLGMDIAAATGEAELPVSKEEWSELQTFKRMLGL